MAKINELISFLSTDKVSKGLAEVYGVLASEQSSRYLLLMEKFHKKYPEILDVDCFSTPGRTEVGGNHTDHNYGKVLAAAVNLDVATVAAKTENSVVTIESDGYPEFSVDISDLSPKENERFTSASLVRGVAARLKELGYKIGGFKAVMTSSVMKGSGLSSSAAFEVQMVNVFNHFYNEGKVDNITNALISQYAENHFFGKPCGLMDQTSCATGGFVTIDFKDPSKPVVEKVDFNFVASGFSLVIVDTGGNHADLNDEYASITIEMKGVAAALGGKVLRDIKEEDVIKNVGMLRSKINDRGILRAFHFLSDNQRVVEEVDALKKNDMAKFLQLVIESGLSSWTLLQNCYTTKNPTEQGLTLALALSEKVLKGAGAWRVHGGGFAGTIQAFVPNGLLSKYVETLQAAFGAHAVHRLSIRRDGCVKINII